MSKMLLQTLLKLAPQLGHSSSAINEILAALEEAEKDPGEGEGEVIGEILTILGNSAVLSDEQKAKIEELKNAGHAHGGKEAEDD